MCFSEQISLLIGLVGIIASIYFYNINTYASIGIGYFALMEIIQFFQYKVINKCEDKTNKFLTTLGYLHICFQPLFFNIWLFAFTKRPNFTFLKLSFAAGLLLASRLLFVKDDEMCDTKNEPLCGPQTCSFSGEKHIAWNLRLRAPGKNWWTPSIGLHFFMWTIPVLTIFEVPPAIAMALCGPYLGYFLTNNIHEMPAIWCYTVISQMLVSYHLLR